MRKAQIAVVTSMLVSAAAAFAEPGWVELFNGKNLDGWVEHSGKAKYSVQGGVLVGEAVVGTGNSFLCTTQQFGDFELQLEYKVAPELNSGVQIRSDCFPEARTLEIEGKKIKVAPDRVHGYQVEIDMSAARRRWWTAGLFDEARRGWLYPADGQKGEQGKAFTAQGAKMSKQDDWNTLRILAVGPSIKTWLNGEARANLTDSLTPRGLIGLQVHSVGADPSKSGLKVQFRNIRIRPL